ncbi:MAG: NAD-dependent epimerase [Spirochaetaceae bacterium]|nr:MAG: NAD-dependent epimerase [Spirochaetaceae bacterium]
MKILVTGTAGFIGFHLAKRLIQRGDEVVGLDSVNDYYDISIKHGRLAETGIDPVSLAVNTITQSSQYRNYRFIQLDLVQKKEINALFSAEHFDMVCNLAAQAGVRYSLTHPETYTESNITGFLNILEACRHNNIKHLVYASSSSVYGLNETMPFSTHDNVDHPISLYAASKKSNELMAHCYSHLFGLPSTALRFFTVYGPWGRPDMALFIFTKSILAGMPIDIFNNGDMIRDFTYIDDIIDGVVCAIDHVPSPDKSWSGKKPDPSSSCAPYKIYNIGNSNPVKLMDFISALENALGESAIKNFLPMQAGDVKATWADTNDLEKELGYKPKTSIKTGIDNFVSWYRAFYGVK